MTNALIMPASDGRFVRHTMATIDDWWHQLPADVKVRIFWLELEQPISLGKPAALPATALTITEVPAPAVPATERRDLLACILGADGSFTTVTLETACHLTGAGAIAERTSYSDDQFDGAPASLFFKVIDQAIFQREMAR